MCSTGKAQPYEQGPLSDLMESLLHDLLGVWKHVLPQVLCFFIFLMVAEEQDDAKESIFARSQAAMPFESPSVFTNKSIYLNIVVVRMQDKDDDLVARRVDLNMAILDYKEHFLEKEKAMDSSSCSM
ncbi:hypothetical protein llap_7110 [Limosa lapponica baueri]|uniref:Uncharacterized protein n=1 Tax=Limosa lapponica baueri TaxID=1758121 RepID=A0A2I0U967_LIMLA|nr:hypothetical protein llap_7110 [Limosa lapponica baueri]